MHEVFQQMFIPKSVRKFLVLMALGYMCAGQAPAFSADSEVPGLACDWVPSSNMAPVSPSAAGLRANIIDSNAGYWQAALPAAYPQGSEFRIRGQFPSSRNMSIQVTSSALRGLKTIAAITDWQIQPDSGSRSPYPAPSVVDPAVPAGGAYSVVVHYGKAPATPAANTLYLDPADYAGGGSVVLVYRVYAPFAPLKISDAGGVPLPSIALITAQGDIPIAQFDSGSRCSVVERVEYALVRTLALSGYLKYAKPLVPAPIPAQPVPAAPRFMLWGGDDELGQNQHAQLVLNADNSYVYTALSQTLADLAVVRARMPSRALQDGAGAPQVRYWSLCTASIEYNSTFACMADADARLDADGYYNVVISVKEKRPANADADHGFNWLDFGRAEPSYPMFRYLSPASSFAQAPQNYFSGGYTALSQLMGSFYPQVTYCSKSMFDQYTAAGATPAQVFAACAAGG